MRVSEGRSITLGADGSGSVGIGPGQGGQQWTITRLTTYGNSALSPTLTVRRSSPGGPVVDVTKYGNGDVSETVLDVFSGEVVFAAYTGGTPGAVMAFYIEGDTA